MNRSFTKLRKISEANIILENRFINEQPKQFDKSKCPSPGEVNAAKAGLYQYGEDNKKHLDATGGGTGLEGNRGKEAGNYINTLGIDSLCRTGTYKTPKGELYYFKGNPKVLKGFVKFEGNEWIDDKGMRHGKPFVTIYPEFKNLGGFDLSLKQ